MRDLLGWNVSLGRWAGVQVRLHFFFLVFAVLALNPQFDPVYGLVALALLLVSTLLHEAAHCVAAVRLGGRAEQIVLWPFGGLVQANVPHEPRAELITSFAGPLANLLVAVLILPPLVLWGGAPVETGTALSFNPLTPPISAMPGDFSWQFVAGLAFWINWMLFLINLLPATPLDGGRVLRSALWPLVGYRNAAVQVAWAARITGLALCVVGWYVSTQSEKHEYAWVPMSLLGVFLFFSAQQDAERLREGDRDDAAFGYDFSQGYTSLERSFEPSRGRVPSALRQWLERRRIAKLELQRQIEEDEDKRVDEVLARLHEQGPDGISPEDRALLDRVSARYRNRETG